MSGISEEMRCLTKTMHILLEEISVIPYVSNVHENKLHVFLNETEKLTPKGLSYEELTQ